MRRINTLLGSLFVFALVASGCGGGGDDATVEAEPAALAAPETTTSSSTTTTTTTSTTTTTTTVAPAAPAEDLALAELWDAQADLVAGSMAANASVDPFAGLINTWITYVDRVVLITDGAAADIATDYVEVGEAWIMTIADLQDAAFSGDQEQLAIALADFESGVLALTEQTVELDGRILDETIPALRARGEAGSSYLADLLAYLDLNQPVFDDAFGALIGLATATDPSQVDEAAIGELFSSMASIFERVEELEALTPSPATQDLHDSHVQSWRVLSDVMALLAEWWDGGNEPSDRELASMDRLAGVAQSIPIDRAAAVAAALRGELD